MRSAAIFLRLIPFASLKKFLFRSKSSSSANLKPLKILKGSVFNDSSVVSLINPFSKSFIPLNGSRNSKVSRLIAIELIVKSRLFKSFNKPFLPNPMKS